MFDSICVRRDPVLFCSIRVVEQSSFADRFPVSGVIRFSSARFADKEAMLKDGMYVSGVIRFSSARFGGVAVLASLFGTMCPA